MTTLTVFALVEGWEGNLRRELLKIEITSSGNRICDLPFATGKTNITSTGLRLSMGTRGRRSLRVVHQNVGFSKKSSLIKNSFVRYRL